MGELASSDIVSEVVGERGLGEAYATTLDIGRLGLVSLLGGVTAALAVAGGAGILRGPVLKLSPTC